MEWLNYHHLFYFWQVVREGGIAAASRRLPRARLAAVVGHGTGMTSQVMLASAELERMTTIEIEPEMLVAEEATTGRGDFSVDHTEHDLGPRGANARRSTAPPPPLASEAMIP